MRAHLALIALLGLSSCATIFRGNTQVTTVHTVPEGAEIYRNGELLGKAPVQVISRGNESVWLEARSEGHEHTMRELDRSVSEGYVILDILVGLIGLTVDGVTGSWYSRPEEMTITLDKPGTTQPAPEGR